MGAPEPFLYFTDHEPGLGRLVTEARRREFRGFSAFSDAAQRERIPDPQAVCTSCSSSCAASRLTVIITMSIPVSLLIALTVMYFAGESLNILSLLGLMISIGLLVDNSVVVAENIDRLSGEGHSRRDAAIEGTGEIALAITTATLTTIVVFLPVSLVEGEAQFFLLRLSMPISVALLASLAAAGVFVPLSVYFTLKNGGKERPRPRYDAVMGALENAYEATLGRLNHGYTKLLAVFLRRRSSSTWPSSSCSPSPCSWR